MSFYVSVPVLSEIKNYILPSSSGILELRATVPAIYSSVLIPWQYQSFAKSKLILTLIGIILDMSSIILKKNIYQCPWNPLRAVIRKERLSRKQNKIFER